jgi:hypothetical protein
MQAQGFLWEPKMRYLTSGVKRGPPAWFAWRLFAGYSHVFTKEEPSVNDIIS